MSQPFDDRHDDGYRPSDPSTGQLPGTPDNDGTGTSGNTAPDQRD